MAQLRLSRSSLVCKVKFEKKLFTGQVHPPDVDSGALAFVRWYVWLVLVKVVRNRPWRCAPVVRFAVPPLTSTSQPGTWLLRIARRGLLAGDLPQLCFNSNGLALKLSYPRAVLELIAGVQIGVIQCARPPHLPDDFQPALTQRPQRAGMALDFGAKRRVVSRRPRTKFTAQVRPLAVQFDHDLRRLPEGDEWTVEFVGYIPADAVEDF
jgi:hypothetical protein